MGATGHKLMTIGRVNAIDLIGKDVGGIIANVRSIRNTDVLGPLLRELTRVIRVKWKGAWWVEVHWKPRKDLDPWDCGFGGWSQDYALLPNMATIEIIEDTHDKP